jgi:exodeoxyribonuclease VII large subunit
VSLSPAATLERGYAIVQRPDETVVRAAAEIKDGAELQVRFADGRVRVTVRDSGD